ncbi:LysR family transcriptional regulator substrate-binding protein [Nocardioides sp. LHD-245]|uniref:LysR family transcriptional regulator substrate-binding protein n=1 Tax=Nocardioides sp. LHD-245 TaxID=3051387 RepID=UPI0027E049E6|nr:LysR family transcriptional regulator substrate-binding protein [Nocardioides sp. LHD-245]
MQELRVAFVPGVTPDKWARAWRERNPRIRLDLLPVEEQRQRAVLDEGAADMALVRLPVDLDRPTALHCVRLYDEVPVVVAGREHFVAAADGDTPIPLADLADEQLVLPHPSGWTPAVEQLSFPEMTVKDAIEVAASGSGIVIVPMSLARLHHRKDVVHRPVELDPTTVALVWLRDADSPVHQDFVGVVRGRRASSSR